MTKRPFALTISAISLAFALAFFAFVLPPALASGDIMGAFMAGFVNPFAAGYALDTICCALVLMAWVLHERTVLGVKHGWVVIPLALVPGVAVAFAVYLLIRSRQVG